MEYIGIEKEAVETIQNRVTKLHEAILAEVFEPNKSLADWIENTELSKLLGLSLSTLHNYRLSGVLSFSTIGRKVYYKRIDIQEFIKSKSILTKKD